MMTLPENPQQALKDAVEALYLQFARYALRKRIDGCTHCVSDEEINRIHAKPLRALSAEDLSRYAFKAMTTWGTLEDFKYFLPRLFELVTEDESLAFEMDVEILFGKLAYAQWHNWPQVEQDTINTFFLALWQSLLASPVKAVMADDLLCAIGQAIDDLTPFLEAWQNATTPDAINHLLDFDNANEDCLQRKRKLCNSFWVGREPQMQQVVAWLLNTQVAKPETQRDD